MCVIDLHVYAASKQRIDVCVCTYMHAYVCVVYALWTLADSLAPVRNLKRELRGSCRDWHNTANVRKRLPLARCSHANSAAWAPLNPCSVPPPLLLLLLLFCLLLLTPFTLCLPHDVLHALILLFLFLFLFLFLLLDEPLSLFVFHLF